jgi:hypothetical protein
MIQKHSTCGYKGEMGFSQINNGKKSDYFLDTDIVKCILKNQNGMGCSGLIWVRIGTSIGFL